MNGINEESDRYDPTLFAPGKRYSTFDRFLKNRFGGKVAKLPLDAGTTCPNRDGSKGIGGCAFCSGRGSGDFCLPGSITEQLVLQREIVRRKWDAERFIPYFQSCTGTYAPVGRLLPLWEEALRFPGAVGLAVATRADCLPDEICEALAEISRRTFLTVELGLQTSDDRTAERMNRCHSYADFVRGFEKLRALGIPVCVHLIDGLPGEDRETMLRTAEDAAALRPEFVKIHLLHVLKGTALEKSYLDGEFGTLSMEEYVGVVCDQIERFPGSTVFERVTGDGKGADLLAPGWSRRKRDVLNSIDKELARRGSYQGMKYSED